MIYSAEPANERPHVHVIKDRATAKIWIDQIEIFHQIGYTQKELATALKIVTEHQEMLLRSWSEIHGD